MNIKEFKKYKIPIIYFILSLIILIPISSNKYFFLLDTLPKLNNQIFIMHFYGFFVPSYGGTLPFDILSNLIPADVFQKLLLLFILFFSGFSAYSLAKKLTNSEVGSFYAGILYMINPYTYIRIIVGHWLILFAYSLLPLGIKYFIELLENRDKRSIIKATLITSLIAFNAHTLFMAFMAYGIILIIKLAREKSIKLLKPVGLFSISFTVLNLYWLIPLLTAKSSSLVNYITIHDLYVFAPKIDSFSALFTLASMYGFWRPAYTYAKDYLPFWEILFVIIFFLSIHGFISYYKNKKVNIYIISFALIWLTGLLFATGVTGPFKDIFQFLFDNIFILKGMRDTHKFVTLIALSYSILGAFGLKEIIENIKSDKIKKAVVVFFILVPLIYSFTFFNAFDNQIKPTDYPKDWYQVNTFLNKDKDDFNILFFPWHLYMDIHWVPNKDKRIANPAQTFFDKYVISAKNIEVPGIYTEVYTPYQNYINHILQNKDRIENFGSLVAPLGVKYILLTKEVDYKNYNFLFKQKDLKLILETKNFYVFKNERYKGKIYSVEGIKYVKNFDELINLSNKEDISKELILIGNGTNKASDKWKPLNYKEINPAKYVIEDKPLKYIIFTNEYSKDWVLNGKKPLNAYGVVNAYEIKENENKYIITYERFYKVCLPSYIISLISLMLCIVCLIKEKLNLKTK
ncbi:alpha-(1-_3)-arabinofuranosyltransferase domain-containing protein [Methanocaldococcus indicus]|uniref:alpha-(1->3)-arabinofuranosyltransferase domain-containing protein n=1 Tax=Methanocaldococcus indicus TaxID=213231 RepID=UPI003C6DB3A4